MKEQPLKTDTSEYTIILVSHHGQGVRSIKVPRRYMKYALAGIAGVFLLVLGMLFDFHSTAANAAVDQGEYERLQQVNGTQSQKFRKLAQQTAELQENMDRLNALDADIRRLMNTEAIPETSRVGNEIDSSRN